MGAIKKVFTNNVILYILTRYITYFIQFIFSLLIAFKLGPYYLGIWGFINLFLGYLAQINLGIPHSVNVIASINKDNKSYLKDIIGNGITMTISLSILIILFFLIEKLMHINIGDKYKFSIYIIPVSIIAILTNFNNLFSNIFRIHGKLFEIALNQSLFPILSILIVPFFDGNILLWVIVIVYAISTIISFLLFLYKSPINLIPKFNFKLIKFIQTKGWHLFIYNSSFYLILLSTRSFISGNYTVKEFGYFTFSYSLANAILLLLNSISYLIFPKLLNRFSSLAKEQVQRILTDVRVSYISLSHFLIHFMIMIFPLFLLFFPEYKYSGSVFRITALTIVLYANSFGYQGLLMAKNKERNLGFISIISLLINIILLYVLVFWLKVNFEYVISATLITYFIYVSAIGILGRKELHSNINLVATLRDIYPIRMMIPYVLSLVLVYFSVPNLFFVIPFILYLIFNYKDIMEIKKNIIKIIRNPNLINI